MTPTFTTVNDLISCSSFHTPGGVEEFYLKIDSREESSFARELDTLFDNYRTALEQLGLTDDTLVFGRFYLSDIANEKDILRGSNIFRALQKGAVSAIQQCPVNGGSLNLFAYHIKRNGTGLTREVFSYDPDNRRNGALIHGDSYDMLWTANFYGLGNLDSYTQTQELFGAYNGILTANGMTLLDNVVRTWVYVRDVDNNYAGMVKARRELFEEQGLTPATRYIASTGIEGFSREVNSLVAFDAFAIRKLAPGQIVRMEAPEHMSPTISYGVTFERGTRIRFGDRSHLHISGTASIDKNGQVVHNGDPRRQTSRAVENVRALLEPQCAVLDDMAYLIVYIRNLKDKNKIMDVLRAEIPAHVPLLFLEGAVCRPGWLVELEGVAVIPDKAPFPDFF